MPQFDIHYFYSQAFWLALIFSALYLIAAKYIIPQLSQISEHRNQIIAHNISESKDIQAKIDHLNEIYDDEISAIKIAQEAITAQYKTKFKNLFDDKQQDLADFISKETKDSIARIANKTTEFYQDKDKATLSLADFIIGKVTGNKADQTLLKQIYQQSN